MIAIILEAVAKETGRYLTRNTHFAVVSTTYEKRKTYNSEAKEYHNLTNKSSKKLTFNVLFRPSNIESQITTEEINAFIKHHPDHINLVQNGWHLSSHNHKNTISIKEYNEQVEAVKMELEEKIAPEAKKNIHTENIPMRASSRPVRAVMSIFEMNKKTYNEDIELDEAKRGRPRKDLTKSASEDEQQEADQNIHTQLHKVLSTGKHVTFNSGEKKEILPQHAHKALSMLQNSKPSERLAIQHSLAHSHNRFKETIETGKAITDASRPKVTLGKIRAEEVDPSTHRSDRGAMIVKHIRKSDGSYVTVKSKQGAIKSKDIIDAQEAMKIYDPKEAESKEKNKKYISPKGNSDDMLSVNRNKFEADPLFSKVKFKLPLTVGNKSAGGEDTVYGGGKYEVAEERILNSLYNNLNETNKELFLDMIETKKGLASLITFATEQGL